MKRLNRDGVATVEYLLAKLDAVVAERTAAPGTWENSSGASLSDIREVCDWLRSLLRGESSASHREAPPEWLY